MGYSKPVTIYGEAARVPSRARESLQKMSQRAQVGGMASGNFASLLRADAEGVAKAAQGEQATGHTAKLLGQGGPAGPQISQRILTAAGIDPGSVEVLGKLREVLGESSAPLRVLNSLSSAQMERLEAGIMRVRVQSHRKDAEEPKAQTPGSTEVSGVLSSRFESGAEGIAAIGYDRNGGTSYGKYQLSSKAGTFDQFVHFLGEKAPDLAVRFNDAGPADTGGKSGNVADLWRQIAIEEPERFEALQDEFVKIHHLEPALKAVSRETEVSGEIVSPTVKEVLFSTAVQHGPAGAARILGRALASLGKEKVKEAMTGATEAGSELFRQIYALREGQFGSSTPQVQAAVKNRLKSELAAALNLLRDKPVA